MLNEMQSGYMYTPNTFWIALRFGQPIHIGLKAFLLLQLDLRNVYRIIWSGALHYLQDCICSQWRLCICAGEPESSQGTLWAARNEKRVPIDSEDTAQYARMRRLIRVFAGSKYSFIRKCCASDYMVLTRSGLKVIKLFYAQLSWAWNFLC